MTTTTATFEFEADDDFDVHFTRFHNYLMFIDMQANSLKLLLHYARFCMLRNKKVTASDETIATMANMSTKTVSRCRNELKKLGLIQVIKQKGQSYIIKMDFKKLRKENESFWESHNFLGEPKTKSPNPSDKLSEPPKTKSPTKNELDKNEYKKTTLQDEPASEKTEPEKPYTDEDYQLAIETVWTAKNTNLTTKANQEDLVALFGDEILLEVEKCAMQNHKANLEPLQPKSERDKLAEAIVQDTEAEQATIKENEAMKALKAEAKAKKDTVPAAQMNPMKDAIIKAFSFDTDKLTRREWSNISGVAKSLCLVKAKPEDIEHLHAHCAKKFTMFGVNALETNYSAWNVTQSKTTDYETQKQIARDMWAEQNGTA